MRNGNTHIIGKQTVEINFDRIESGMGMQDRMAGLFYERIQPGMEKLFDELADADHTAYIENLEIDCGVLPEKNWEDECVDAVLRQLKEKLLLVNKKPLDADTINHAFFHFLGYGFLPWNCTISSEKIFEEKIVPDTRFTEQLQKKLQQQDVLLRLLNQFSEKFVTTIIHALLQKNKEKNEEKVLYADILDQPFAGKSQQEKIIKAIVKQGSSENDINEMLSEGKLLSDPDRRNAAKEMAAALFVGNAGLVLLHPYLPALFEYLHLTANDQWINEQAQQQAVTVTAFLTSGVPKNSEFNLVLNKLLCGLSANTVLLPATEWQPVWQQECEAMLQEVINNWGSLKNTGIEAFRESFLQREGKLSVTDNGKLLQVAQKSMDVLLNTLPWGIGVIKLPWMKEILFTEWIG